LRIFQLVRVNAHALLQVSTQAQPIEVVHLEYIHMRGIKIRRTQSILRRPWISRFGKHFCACPIQIDGKDPHNTMLARTDLNPCAHAIAALGRDRRLRARRSIAAMRTATPISTCS